MLFYPSFLFHLGKSVSQCLYNHSYLSLSHNGHITETQCLFFLLIASSNCKQSLTIIIICRVVVSVIISGRVREELFIIILSPLFRREMCVLHNSHQMQVTSRQSDCQCDSFFYY